MREFHNPYHFVPATGRVHRDGQDRAVETEDYADIKEGRSAHPARHDRWVPGTHSGRLVCRLELERPTLVGGAQTAPADGNPNGAKQVEPYRTTWRDPQGKDHTWPGFPGSSLRGMVSAVAEAISQSSLRVLEDRAYSVRVNMGEDTLSALGRLVERKPAGAAGPRFDLVPVGLPTLHRVGDRFALPPRWRPVFKDFTWGQVLTAYVDGYEPVPVAGGGTQPRLRVETFLATEHPTSFDPAHPCYYYAKLTSGMTFQRSVLEPIDADLKHPFDPARPALKAKDGNYLLGRQLEHVCTLAQWGQLSEPQKNLYVRGYLRVLGIDGRADEMPPTKKHEILIPHPDGKPEPHLPVPQQVVETFHALAKERADETDNRHPFALSGIDHWRCRDGDLVYFDVDEQGAIKEIAICAIWRRRLGKSTHDFFDALTHNHVLTPLRADPKDLKPRPGLTPAELLFGVVEDGREKDDPSASALASRVRVFDAVAFRAPKTASHPLTLKTLSSPKPPSPALYFHDGSNPQTYIPKGRLGNDAGGPHRPNGRKFYLHHPAAGFVGDNPEPWTCTSRAGDQRDHLRLSCRPLVPEKGNPFWFHLDFDNLSDAELTLLVAALRPSDAHRHKLGLGKSLGLGTVCVDIAGLFLVDRQHRYGLKALEQPRYARGWLRGQPGVGAPAWAARYPREAAAVVASTGSGDWSRDLAPEHQPWWNPRLIDENALAILTTLGDPTKLQPGTPVHTPLTAQQRQSNPADPGRTEDETFKWFVANAQPGGHQVLGKITPGQPLPTLPYL